MTSSRATTICITWKRTGGFGTITGRALTSELASDSGNGGTRSPLIPRTRRSRWILSCRWCVRSSPANLETFSSRATAESLFQPGPLGDNGDEQHEETGPGCPHSDVVPCRAHGDHETHNRPASVADRQLTDTTGAQDHGDRRPEDAAADAEPAQPAARTRRRRRGTAPERVALLTSVTGTGHTWRGRHRAHSGDA